MKNEKLIVKEKENKEDEKSPLYKKLIAEFIGTFLLNFIPCAAGTFSGAGVAGCNLAGCCNVIFLGLTLGGVSGCMVNPAMSITFYLRGLLTFPLFILYTLAQYLGGTFAMFMIGVFKRDFTNVCANQIGKLLYNKDGELDNYSYFLALLSETIFTGLLSFTVFVSMEKKFNQQSNASLMIGCVVCALFMAGGGLTGPCINPAKSFGSAIVEFFAGKTDAFKQLWVFTLGPIMGGIFGAIMCKSIY